MITESLAFGTWLGSQFADTLHKPPLVLVQEIVAPRRSAAAKAIRRPVIEQEFLKGIAASGLRKVSVVGS
jgi:hypothetical protein